MNGCSNFDLPRLALESALGIFSASDFDGRGAIFDAFMNTIPAGFVIKDESLLYVYVNRYLKELFGEDRWLGRRASDIYPGDPAVADIDEEDRRALGGATLEVFITLPDRSGIPRHFRITKFPIRTSAGQRLLGYIILDVTELTRAQEELARTVAERELLVKEVHHRVKNNLATVASLIRLGSDGIEDPKAAQAFEASYRRIDSLALLHEELYGSESLASLDFGRFLKTLAERVFVSLATSPRIGLSVSADTLVLPMNSAVPLALIVNELISNSLKHGFPSGSAGSITVCLTAEGGRCRLRISDDGGGLPPGLEPDRSDSLGLVLIHQLARQLGGRAEYESGTGTSCTITFQSPTLASVADDDRT
ncbi:MAG TPA: histidine kinase dimerization/phosphoacceptor domain -containing protein [Rectinemataceae bacterium]|nr:histidine kinase dimerization/phosphoacceptor domain -containing protein [Rectinemataceae bacterium]